MRTTSTNLISIPITNLASRKRRFSENFPVFEEPSSSGPLAMKRTKSSTDLKRSKSLAELINMKNNKKLTVLLDLDETLIHTCSSLELQDETLRSYENLNAFRISVEGEQMLVLQRPNLREFLQKASSQFNLILFTASTEEYTRLILNQIDPEKKYFKKCYFRQHCTPCLMKGSKGTKVYVKDLRVATKEMIPLERLVLVDNSSMSFAFQPDNGVPITSFMDDCNDNALMVLLQFLEELAVFADVRTHLNSIFHMQNYFQQLARSTVGA